MPMLQAIPARADDDGPTTELAVGPDPNQWQWHISMVPLAKDDAWSARPGVDRQLVPLDGSLRLRLEDGRMLEARRLQVLRFDGNQSVTCHLPDGPGRGFSLMLRDGVDGDLVARPLSGSMVWLPRTDTRWLACMLSGQADVSVGDERLLLKTGHAVWIRPRAGTRVLIDGSGEIALVRLTLPETPRETVDPASA